jgi:hypothetical protein
MYVVDTQKFHTVFANLPVILISVTEDDLL